MHDRIIQAAIVNHERTHVIVDSEGRLPEARFETGNGTVEDTLMAIGRGALANVPYVSVDHRHVVDGAQLYQTKPVPAEAETVDPYRWADIPGHITLK